VVIISGDTHWGEVSKVSSNVDYPLWEVTSSGLTKEWKNVSPNKHRVGNFINKVNYGELLIDWNLKDPKITLQLKNVNGDVFTQHSMNLSDISAY
jgi:alkaline phosphatase D